MTTADTVIMTAIIVRVTPAAKPVAHALKTRTKKKVYPLKKWKTNLDK
jgi:hypothetical protein